MTEEILQAAVMKLKARATERFAIIKDLYHRPATTETTEQIVQHSIALAQLEGAMITLQQYSGTLAKQTVDEEISNTPEEPTPVEVEEEPEPLCNEDLETRSPKFRQSKEAEKSIKRVKPKAKKDES